MTNILNTLAFFAKYSDGWHSYDKTDRATVSAINSLVNRGYLEVNDFGQARFTGKALY
jgi:hypothetical protein